MTTWLERLWYPVAGEGLTLLQRLALLLLLPLSGLFTAIAARRRQQLSQSAGAPPAPTLIVGNLSVGGTGKTPLVIALIKRLHADGYRVGVISRGYGGDLRGSASYPLSVARHPQATLVGDEPLLIHLATGAPVYVDPDRPRARHALLQDHPCDLVISDDGLQHYALSRDFELVVIDAKRGLGNGYCLPAGPLREPPTRLEDIDAIVVNQGASIEHVDVQAAATQGTEPDACRGLELDTVPGLASAMSSAGLAEQRCWPMTLVTEALRPLHVIESDPKGTSTSAESASCPIVPPQSGETITAAAGIGNPSRFFDTLRALGYKVIEQPFPDHHDFQLADFSSLQGPVVMTEKDAVKCRSLLPQAGQQFWVLGVSAKLPDALYEQILRNLLGVAPPVIR